MAEAPHTPPPPDLTSLPIDELPEVPLPEVVPLKLSKVQDFLNSYKQVLKFLEKWAKVHLKVVASHPASPTPEPDNLIDEINKKDLEATKDRVFSEFNPPEIGKLELPIGYVLDSDDGDDVDEIQLVDPQLKAKKGSLFKRMLKWPAKLKRSPSPVPKIRTKKIDEEELELEKQRLKSYERLKESFADLLIKEVERYKEARDSRMGYVHTPLLEGSDHREWIKNMNQRLHVCYMAFKLLGLLRETCKEICVIQTFGEVGPERTFLGEAARNLQNRIAYLSTTKVLAFMLVKDTERIQLHSDTYRECVEQFERIRKKKGNSLEKQVREKMTAKKSILPDIEHSPDVIEENLKKQVSVQNLLHATDGDNIDLTIHHPLTLPKETTKKPAPGGGLNVPGKLMSPSSGYGGSKEGLLVDVPIPVVDPNQPGGSAVPLGGGNRPSLLDLSNPVVGPGEIPSPMQLSPTEEVPSDAELADDKKE